MSAFYSVCIEHLRKYTNVYYPVVVVLMLMPAVLRAQGTTTVLDVHLFYNGSTFDGNGAVVDADDFAAIATDKVSVGYGAPATFASVSGYNRGINGLFIDVDGLPMDGELIDAADFAFAAGVGNFSDTWDAVEPASVGVLPGQGEDGSDRVFITFDNGAISDTWLRTRILAGADTGLAADEDFFYGAAPGETRAGFVPGIVGVDAADLQQIAQNLTPLAQAGTELITENSDLNRDRSVNAFDLQVVATNLDINVFRLITPQVGLPLAAAAIPEPGTAVLLGLAATCWIVVAVRPFSR